MTDSSSVATPSATAAFLAESAKQSLPNPLDMPGFNVLLMGAGGSGKTHSIGTLVDSGVEVFCLFLESGIESLVSYYLDRGKPIPDNLHWHIAAGHTASFEEMQNNVQKINTLSLEAVSKLTDSNRSRYNQFYALLTSLHQFTDDRTGFSYGAVDSWDNSRALVIDGLTGLNNASLANIVGGKPVRSQSDWGIAQNTLENLLRKLTDQTRCHFVLLAHIEREVDPVLGGIKIMPSTLGKAFAPKLQPMFSDVILCVQDAQGWHWETLSASADVKTRNLARSAALPQDFRPLYATWSRKQAAFAAAMAPRPLS